MLRAPRRTLLFSATVALSIASTAVPARAAIDLTVAPTSYACQIGDLTVSALAPFGLVTPLSTGAPFTVNASGTCSGPSGLVTLILDAGANSLGTSTCAAMAGIGWGTLTLAGIPYGGNFELAQPGAVGTAVLTMQTGVSPGSMISVFTLDVSPASLEACLLNGATSVDYAGTAVITFT